MKKFRVREKYFVSGWTYIEAEDIQDAEGKFDVLDTPDADFREDEREHDDIDWGSLEEVK